ncbi:hypothetical protein EON77_02645 [bacterium]|nr:MAG: hypothetical protein EON77_02645 [bacterium]
MASPETISAETKVAPFTIPTELLESPGYQMWLATNAWQRIVRTGLEPLGVTHAQYAVLVTIARLRGIDARS